MKILLFGAAGQIGWELQRSLQPLGELVALSHGSQVHAADFSSPALLARTLQDVRPDIVVNAAAHTAVDRAESEPDLARLLNAEAPAVLARECARLGAWLLHFSTDYVFDGSGERPWREDDVTAPLNVYGLTKLEGEQAIRQHAPHHLILRTSWVYAARGQNFARTMLRLARERESIQVIDDQIGAPTGADLLADVSAHLLRAVVADGDARRAGTYHVACAGATSWNGYARLVLQTAHARGVPLKCTPERVWPVPSSAFQAPARRPMNSRLDTTRVRDTFHLYLPDWQGGVQRMLDEIL